MLLGQIEECSFVWNFEFSSLVFVWDLDFEVWDFKLFIEPSILQSQTYACIF